MNDTLQRSSLKREFLNIEFSILEKSDIFNILIHLSRCNYFSYIVTPNADHIVKLNDRKIWYNEKFRLAYNDAAIRTCDSRIVQRLAKLNGINIPLVTGSDLTEEIFTHLRGRTDKVVIIGGNIDSVARLSVRFPGPDYQQLIPEWGVLTNAAEQQRIAEFIRKVKPNYSFFAFGAPQSEITARLCAQTDGTTGVGLCIGASIDFLTGHQHRAPKLVQKSGMEWAYRLGREPKRLWRRYLLECPKIFAIMMRS